MVKEWRAVPCDHERILVVWNEDGSLDQVWCGVCESDVTPQLQAEVVKDVLDEELVRHLSKAHHTPRSEQVDHQKD